MPEGTDIRVVRFGNFEVDLRSRELRRNGLAVKLQGQPFLVLTMLLERPGELVTREEIRQRLWPGDTFVDFEHGLNTAIKRVRDALGEAAENPVFIETLPRRGYRLRAPVQTTAVTRSDPGRRVVLFGEPTAAEKPEANVPRQQPPIVLPVVVVTAVLVIAAATWLYVRDRMATPIVVQLTSLPDLEQRQLTANSSENTVWSGAISPNGKYLAYVDTTGIRLKHLETGELGTLPEPAGLSSGGVRWRIASWFPDSSAFIAVACQAPHRASTWLVSLVGQPPRPLRDNAAAWSVSPDGNWIAFTTADTEFGLVGSSGHEIWLMRANGDDARRLETEEGSTFSRLKWSPDGTSIGYLKRYRDERESKESIEARDIEHGARITIVSSPGLEDFVWLPTRQLLFVADEPGSDAESCNLSKIVVAPSGKPMSKADEIAKWAGYCADDLSATSDGKILAFHRWSPQSSAYVARINPDQMHISEPRRLTLNEGLNVPTAWSDDSRSIIFSSRQNGRTGIFKQSLDKETPIPLVTGLDDVEVPRLGPDRNSVIYVKILRTSDPYPPVQIMRVPIQGGPPQPLLTAFLMASHRCAPRAGLCAFAERSADQKQIIITALDLLKGRGRELVHFDFAVPTEEFYVWDISPDASRIALLQAALGKIVILPVATRGERHDLTVKSWKGLASFDWTADGNGFFSSALTTRGSVLLHVDMNGDARVLWEVRGGTSVWAVPSPDGQRLVLSSFLTGGNIWTIKNF